MSEILVTCRKCQSKAPASSMKLDVDLGLMICPTCVKNKAPAAKLDNHPIDPEHNIKFSRPTTMGSESLSKLKQKCKRCSFEFKVNTETKTPKYCPYCNAPVFGLY